MTNIAPSCISCVASIYIPVWFYYDFTCPITGSSISPIYIPVWFYYDPADTFPAALLYLFTFQYGSIMTNTVRPGAFVINSFTFQYGSIMTFPANLY